MKEKAKRNKTVIHDDPRIGIGLNMVPPELGGFKQKVMFKDFYLTEAVASTSIATDSKL
jgi:hypothetical protein